MTAYARLAICAAGSLIATACSHASIASPSARHITAASRTQAQPAFIETFFDKAQGKEIKDEDIENYIHPAVRGTDRQLAHRFMKLMPKDLRGDFVFLDAKSGRVVSNNPELVRNAIVTTGTAGIEGSGANTTAFRTRSAVRRTSVHYHDGCSPHGLFLVWNA